MFSLANLAGRKVQHKEAVLPFLFFPIFFLLDQKKVLDNRDRHIGSKPGAPVKNTKT